MNEIFYSHKCGLIDLDVSRLVLSADGNYIYFAYGCKWNTVYVDKIVLSTVLIDKSILDTKYPQLFGNPATDMVVSKSEKYIITSDGIDFSIKVCDRDNNYLIKYNLIGGLNQIKRLVVSPDENTLISYEYYILKIWDIITGTLIKQITQIIITNIEF